MKHIVLIALLASNIQAENISSDPVKAFTHTMTCSVILGRAAADAEPRISFNREAPEGRVFIGIWAEMQAASTTYENAANRYYAQIRQSGSEYKDWSHAGMYDAVHRGIAKMSKEQQVKYGKACITGYNLARKSNEGAKYKI